MILAMSNIAWPWDSRLAVYAEMSALGITGLEVAPGLLFPGCSDPFRPDDAALRMARGEVAAAGLTLVSMQSLLFGVAGAALFGDADARTRFRLGMERAIALAERLRIPNLVFGSPRQRVIPSGMSSDAARALATEMFHGLGDRAADAGTVIAMEANPQAYGTNFLITMGDALSFVKTLHHPSVRLVLDLGTMILNGEAHETIGTLPTLLPWLSHVHVSEPYLAPAPADPAAVPPLLTALRRNGYSRAVSIEMKQPDDGLPTVRNSLLALRSAAIAGGVPG
jgi:sugar phosphate isomerase/epimerase